MQTFNFVPLAHVFKFTSSAPQQFLGSPLLLILLIFFKLPWRLWLRYLSNPIMTLSSPNLDLGFSFLFRIIFRCTFRITHLGMFRAFKQCPDNFRSLRHCLKPPRPIKTHQAYLGHLSPLRYTWPIKYHLSPIQVHLGSFKLLRPIWTSLDPLRLIRPIQVTQAHLAY